MAPRTCPSARKTPKLVKKRYEGAKAPYDGLASIASTSADGTEDAGVYVM